MPFETVTGYCWPPSVAPGEAVGLHLSSPGGRPVRVEVARVGGTRDVMWSDTVPAEFHPTPEGAAANGCGWPAAVTVDVGDDWRSGYHEVVLTVHVDGKRRTSHAFFVVRPSERSQNTILLQLASNTLHAYNDFGGRNLYTGATTVSLQRPMSPGYLHKPPGPGRRVTNVVPDDRQMTAHIGYLRLNHLSPYAGSAGWPDWEQPFVQWAEREGYGIDVVLNSDLEEFPDLVERYRLIVSVGHDEYWSGPMRDTVEAHIARGGNVAFFSGNTSLWQVRLEGHDGDGRATQMVGWKGRFRDDPLYGTDRQAEVTTLWSDVILERPENHMTGVSFTRGGYHRIGKNVTNGAGGYTVHRPDHWLFEGTGIGYGDVLGGEAKVVGYECDGCAFTYRDGLPHPTGEDGTPGGFEILGTVPVAHFTHASAPRPPAPGTPSELEYISSRVFGERGHEHRIAHGHAVLGTYTAAGGGTVVTSGSTDWAHGLTAHDRNIERITANVLDRLGD
jgi:hypothetical protein